MDIVIPYIKAFFTNYLLVSAMLGWLFAQIIKVFTGLYQRRNMGFFKILFSTGGMPSSHSSTVVALSTAAAFQEGLDSPIFAVCAILSMVVMIDASGVRYETGKQAVLLNKISREIFSGDTELMNSGLKELVGHTPFQVVMGALLGLGIGIAMYFVMMR